jgi:hypothetical protein
MNCPHCHRNTDEKPIPPIIITLTARKPGAKRGPKPKEKPA